MRDKKRIRAFCNRLADAWEQCPDLRFGQFMMNVFGRMGKDPFFPEDDEMIRCIEQYVEDSYRVVLRVHRKEDGRDDENIVTEKFERVYLGRWINKEDGGDGKVH